MIDNPIFVRGFSRSGGTLLVTILDAHPEIAMSYELYPNLLKNNSKENFNLQDLLELLQKAKTLKKFLSKINNRNLYTFISRCPRGGLSHQDIVLILDQHLRDEQSFDTFEERMLFIQRCCMVKMQIQQKSRWGLKCNNQFKDYATVWPNACFLNIIRDGRDVLASQLNTGSFRNSPAQVGKGWANTHLKFREFSKQANIKAYEVFYEKLVQNPEQEIKKICNFLEIKFHDSMLNFYKQKLDIYKTSHLSLNRISKPIDSSKIGRWKKELTPEQLEQFNSTAKEAMNILGYYNY